MKEPNCVEKHRLILDISKLLIKLQIETEIIVLQYASPKYSYLLVRLKRSKLNRKTLIKGFYIWHYLEHFGTHMEK